MKRVLVKSVFDIFDYVMQHYYPAGLEEMVEKSDTYVVISIQDSHTEGFGITFSENKYCKGVLTLRFDDIIRPVNGAILFSKDMAIQIIKFIRKYVSVDTLLIHCYAGQSRSRAVGAFAVKMLGGNNSKYFTQHNPNMYVYKTLERELEEIDAETEYKEPINELFFAINKNSQQKDARFSEKTIPDMDKLLEDFCNSKPKQEYGMYLDKASELYELYNEVLCIMDEERTPEKEKLAAELVAEMKEIIDE